MKYVKLLFLVLLFVLLLTNCSKGPSAPLTPNAPLGPIIGITNYAHAFRASTTDPDGDDVSYQFNWGDGTASPWSDFIPSGDTVSMSRIYWGKGTFPVRVRAQDETEETSQWSDPLYLLIGYPDTVVDNFGTGIEPSDIEVLPNGQYIYVTNYDDDNVRVIDSDHLPMGTIAVGTEPIGVTALPNSQYVYIMVSGEDFVLALPTSSGTPDTIPVAEPWYATALPNGEYVYVTSPFSNKIYIIRTSDNTLVDSVNAGGMPYLVEALPDGQSVYVATDISRIYEIRTSDNTITDTLSIGGYMAVSPDGEYLYVSSSSSVYVVQTSNNTVIDTVSVGGSPRGLCVHPSGLLVYVANHSSNNVSVIYTPTNKVIKNIQVFDGPTFIDPSPDGEYIYVLHNQTYAVAVIGYSE